MEEENTKMDVEKGWSWGREGKDGERGRRWGREDEEGGRENEMEGESMKIETKDGDGAREDEDGG
jgi:hypothetical protein